MLVLSKRIADVTIGQTVHTSSNQARSSGYKFSIILCNTCVLKQVEVFRPLLYIHVDNISATAKKISDKLRTTTKILNFDQI